MTESIAEQLQREYEEKLSFAWSLPGKWRLLLEDTRRCWQRYGEQTHLMTLIERRYRL